MGFCFLEQNGRRRFSLDTTNAKTAGHQNGIEFGQLGHAVGCDAFGFDVFDVDPHMVFMPAWRSASFKDL